MSEPVSYKPNGHFSAEDCGTGGEISQAEHYPLCFSGLGHSAVGDDGRLAQRSEHSVYTRGVASSNLALPTNPSEVHPISLTRGFSAVVDPEDFERFGHLKWTATVQKRSDGSLRVYAYRNVWGSDGKCRTTFLHRAIFGAAPGENVDHEDRDGLNCRRYNLRSATGSQNSANRTVTKLTKYGFLGIDSQTPGRFRGRVMVGERAYYTKTLNCPRTAAIARDALVIELHGAYAVTNASLGLLANFPAMQAGQQCA